MALGDGADQSCPRCRGASDTDMAPGISPDSRDLGMVRMVKGVIVIKTHSGYNKAAKSHDSMLQFRPGCLHGPGCQHRPLRLGWTLQWLDPWVAM